MSQPFLFVVVSLASYSAWRLLAIDDLPPVVWARNRALDVIRDRFGPEWERGVACAWCSGFWISAIVVGVVWWLHPLALPGLWFVAVRVVMGMLSRLLDD